MPANSSTKKVSLSLVGASGKMGLVLQELIAEDPELMLSDHPDVVIDFSAEKGTKKAIKWGKPLVCGTTGLSEETFKQLQSLAKFVPVVYSPNFSLGIALLFEVAPFLAKHCDPSQILIEETHHTEKKDSPSGTALRLKEFLNTPRIESIREKGEVGTHRVQFNFEDEKLEIAHFAFSRRAFAKGAILAAKKILSLPPNYYSFREILFENKGKP